MMRTVLLPVVLLLGALALAAGAEPPGLAERAQEILSGQDRDAKKAVLSELARKGDDAVVMPLLIAAVDDRQAGRFAVQALRTRTGLQPAAAASQNTGYPGYPAEDTTAQWRQWYRTKLQRQQTEAGLDEIRATIAETERIIRELAERRAEAERKRRQAEAERAREEAAAADEQEASTTTPEEHAAEPDRDGDTEPAADADPDLGSEPEQPDEAEPADQAVRHRIHLQERSIDARILERRTGLDGELRELVIEHPDGGGEQVIEAERIERIEELP